MDTNNNKIICLYCKKEHQTKKPYLAKKQKFCSTSCKISSNNKLRQWSDEAKLKLSERAKAAYQGKNNPNYKGGGKIFICINCGKQHERPIGQLTGKKYVGKYCSLNCYHSFRASKRISDCQLKVHKRFGRNICELVRRNNPNSKSTMLNHVDFNIQELRNHLESLFSDGMTWDNYGKNGWHIDHVKPASYFNFSEYGELGFRECWSLKNLQPLWELENWSKGGRNTKRNQKIYGNN